MMRSWSGGCSRRRHRGGSRAHYRSGVRCTASCRAKGVTLALLREEYKAVHPEGLLYSWFCEQLDVGGRVDGVVFGLYVHL